jgi:hypothetical protein
MGTHSWERINPPPLLLIFFFFFVLARCVFLKLAILQQLGFVEDFLLLLRLSQ